MIQRVLLRGLSGMPTGIAIGYVLSILSSLSWGQGHYAPCTPYLVNLVGSEIGAVVAQTAAYAAIGFTFAASSLLYEREGWSLAKRTLLHYLLVTPVMLVLALLLGWMGHTLAKVLFYLAFFTALFVFFWLIQYLYWRARVRQLNEGITGEQP